MPACTHISVFHFDFFLILHGIHLHLHFVLFTELIFKFFRSLHVHAWINRFSIISFFEMHILEISN